MWAVFGIMRCGRPSGVDGAARASGRKVMNGVKGKRENQLKEVKMLGRKVMTGRRTKRRKGRINQVEELHAKKRMLGKLCMKKGRIVVEG